MNLKTVLNYKKKIERILKVIRKMSECDRTIEKVYAKNGDYALAAEYRKEARTLDYIEYLIKNDNHLKHIAEILHVEGEED